MIPSVELLARLRVLEQQNETLRGYLFKAHERNVELKRQRDNMQNTLKHARASRDEWKRRAMKYQRRASNLYSRIWDARASRDMWKYRALTREIEEERVNPRSKAWLTRNAT